MEDPPSHTTPSSKFVHLRDLVFLPTLTHKQISMVVPNDGARVERVPAWIKRVTQEIAVSPVYDARFWNPPKEERYVFKNSRPKKPLSVSDIRSSCRHILARTEGHNLQGVYSEGSPADQALGIQRPSNSWPLWSTLTMLASAIKSTVFLRQVADMALRMISKS